MSVTPAKRAGSPDTRGRKRRKRHNVHPLSIDEIPVPKDNFHPPGPHPAILPRHEFTLGLIGILFQSPYVQ